MESERAAIEEQTTWRIFITCIAAVLISMIAGITYYNLEADRNGVDIERAKYNAYHHEGGITEEGGKPPRVKTIRLDNFVDTGSPQTWTLPNGDHVYKIVVERVD